MYPEARTTVWLRFGSTWFTTFGPASGAWLPWPWPSASHWVEVLLKASGLPSQVLYLSQSSGLQVLYLHNAEQLISGCQFWNCLSLDKPWRFDLSESGRPVLRMEGQWNSKLCTPSIMQACSVILICLLEFFFLTSMFSSVILFHMIVQVEFPVNCSGSQDTLKNVSAWAFYLCQFQIYLNIPDHQLTIGSFVLSNSSIERDQQIPR